MREEVDVNELAEEVEAALAKVFGEWELGLLARAVVIAELLDEDANAPCP
ncbi:hypothetical protein [Streptomyces rimosus]|nr:hypothetical protein [Streptomyces rimosus]